MPDLDSELVTELDSDVNSALDAYLPDITNDNTDRNNPDYDIEFDKLWDTCGDDGCIEIIEEDINDKGSEEDLCEDASISEQAPGPILEQNVDNLAERNAVVYTAGYVARRLLFNNKFKNPKKNNQNQKSKTTDPLCTFCKDQLIQGEKNYSSDYSFINSKQYDLTKEGGLLYPTSDFYTLIESMISTYNNYFDEILTSSLFHNKMKSHLNSTYKHVFGNRICNCNLLERIIDVLTPMKTKFALRKLNVEIKSAHSKKFNHKKKF